MSDNVPNLKKFIQCFKNGINVTNYRFVIGL